MDEESPILRDRWRRLKKVVKKVIVYGTLAVSFNYFGLPICSSVYSCIFKQHVKDKKVQQVCRTDSYLENIIANIDTKNCDVLPIVKSAHALTVKYLTYKTLSVSDQIFSSREKRIALEKGEADCSFFSTFTYSNFLYLADKLGRPELKNQVRLCHGCWEDGLHVWLQVYLNNKWNNYETTVDPLERKDKINFNDIDAEFSNYWVFAYTNYYPFSYIQFEKDKLTNHTKLFGSIESGMDCVRLLLKKQSEDL